MSEQNKQQPSGLAQSALGGLHPELRARIAVAQEAVSFFKDEMDAFIKGDGNRPLLEDHAWRLYSELRSLLDAIERLSK